MKTTSKNNYKEGQQKAKEKRQEEDKDNKTC
jgi:hypothetical protein